MIYSGAKPRVAFEAKYKRNKATIQPDIAKKLSRAIGQGAAKGTSAFLDSEGTVTHLGKTYRCTVVRIYTPVKE